MRNAYAILYEDDHCWLVNKPPGLPTIPDRYDPERPNLRTLMEDRFGRVWIVHRLDADTSGLLCVARTAEAHRDLSLQFERREVEKKYHALVSGRPDPETGQIDRPIAPDPSRPGRMRVQAKGKASLTDYRVLEALGPCSLVEVVPHTGRTHQIRVHMLYLGCPLWVDPLYGRQGAFFLSELKGKKYTASGRREERPLLGRLSLHAAGLQFRHPQTRETLAWEAPWPKDFAATVKQLRKWGGKAGN